MQETISGWARQKWSITNSVHAHAFRDALNASGETLIARGAGRSYGDSSLQSTVVCSTSYNNYISFDSSTGVLLCQSGVTLGQILKDFEHAGWTLPVLPGTAHVTVGGAIAADVHGKNHPEFGCFSECVIGFEVATNSDTVYECERNKNADLFFTTCGGMGLTGLILDVRLQLQKIKSLEFDVTVAKAKSLDELLVHFNNDSSATHNIAWIDVLAPEKSIGRGIFSAGKVREGGFGAHSPHRPESPIKHLPKMSLSGLCAPWAVRAVNTAYFYSHFREKAIRRRNYESFLFPLDRIENWNAFLGRSGFVQYQCVIPAAGAANGLLQILQILRRAAVTPFLASVKKMGKANQNPLSFPLEGYSLAVDIKYNCQVPSILTTCDDVVLEHGGRVYLAKDAHMSEAAFKAFYPRWSAVLNVRHEYNVAPQFASLQSKRLGLTP